MGKQKLGDFIRKIDYLGAKPENEYTNRKDDPSQQLKDVESQYSNITLEEIKDAFAAFKEKVGVRNFPPKGSPSYRVACSTVYVLNRRVSHLKSNHDELTTQLTELTFHTLVEMLKGGGGSAHCAMVMELFSFVKFGIDLENYAQTLKQQDVASAILAAKVDFTYTPNDYITEKQHAALQNDTLKRFILMFSPEQIQSVQREFLDVYCYYHTQLPGLSANHMREMHYVVRDMSSKFDQKNPYLHLKDKEILQNHLKVIQNAVCSENYEYRSYLDDTISKMLEKILQATIVDSLVADVVDTLMQVLLQIIGNKNARQQAEQILDKYRVYFFKEIPESMSQAVYRPCITTIHELLDKDETITKPETRLVENVVDRLILKAKKLAPDDVKLALTVVRDMLWSGKKDLVSLCWNALEALRKAKSLDWKLHMTEAGEIMKAVCDIPDDKLQDDSDSWKFSTANEYRSFLDNYFSMLRRAKVIKELQAQLVHVFFTCLSTGSKEKAEIAYECSDDENLNFSKAPELRLEVLRRIPDVLQYEHLPWHSWKVYRAIENIMKSLVESFGSGDAVTEEENNLLMAIFKQCSVGEDSIEEHWYQEDDEDTPNVNMSIWQGALTPYASLHEESKTSVMLEPIMSEVIRWAKIAAEEEHKGLLRATFDVLHYISNEPATEFAKYMPDVIDLMIKTEKCRILDTFVTKLYPHNHQAVHDKLQDIFDSLEDIKDDERSYLLCIINEIAQVHAEVFTPGQIRILLDRYQKASSQHEKNIIVIIFKHISENHPKGLVEFFPQMCDDSIFKPETLNFRCNTIACIGAVNQTLGKKAVDYLMKYIDYADGMIALYVAGTLNTMIRDHQDYMQRYKRKLEQVENTGKLPQVKDLAHSMILVLEGKSVEQIAEDVQQQQEDIADIDEKVDTTINTVVAIGDKVIEHDKEIGELEEGLDKIEERVDDVEEDIGDTKIKVEEIDNKTMTNAPKWSRDLTKLMNDTAENDWRLLASRLGYNNDDIRGWATQHDPCMALLSEWYATHKTSEASYGVLTALTEMNRMDGAAIVENAMKQAEGVVEDEEFEYSSPPPVFISYQWGFQNEVKLLKQHLNMAGYECWMDVGQMGGGDKLFAKIDNGIRGAKIVICCVTEKYAQSPNCNREVNLSVNLNKPIIPLLMEKMDWPPKGSMGPIFSEYLFIRFFQRGGEETPDKDQRYWPIPKFQELLMQLNFFVVPDEKMVQKEYARWWAPMTEDIVVDKNRSKKQVTSQKPQQKDTQVASTPLVFLSYQWGKQPQVKALYQRLTSLGYTVWMDIYQMGGGDSLYDKIDRGMRGCKAVVSCVTQKYSLSANCRREVSLADALKKPVVPLLLEEMKWPPDGPMSMVFTELLYINVYRDDGIQMTWRGEKFDELTSKLKQFVPEIEPVSENKRKIKETPKPISSNSSLKPKTTAVVTATRVAVQRGSPSESSTKSTLDSITAKSTTAVKRSENNKWPKESENVRKTNSTLNGNKSSTTKAKQELEGTRITSQNNTSVSIDRKSENPKNQLKTESGVTSKEHAKSQNTPSKQETSMSVNVKHSNGDQNSAIVETQAKSSQGNSNETKSKSCSIL